MVGHTEMDFASFTCNETSASGCQTMAQYPQQTTAKEVGALTLSCGGKNTDSQHHVGNLWSLSCRRLPYNCIANPQCKTSSQPLHAEGQRGLTPPSNRHKCADLPALATPRPCTYGSCTYVIQCTHKRTKRCLQFILPDVTYHSSLPFLNFLHFSLNSLKQTISVAERGAVR